MTIVYPESTPVLGAVKVKAVTAIADLEAPQLGTEVDAATSIDMSLALMAAGWAPSITQGKSTRMRRLGSKRDLEILNPALAQMGAVQYSVGDPQNPDSDITGLLVPGALLYFVERLGPDAEDVAFAASDLVRVHYLRLGELMPMYDATADNGEFYRGQEAVYVNNGPVDGTLAA